MNKSKIFKELTRSEIQNIISNLYGSQTKMLDFSLMKGGVFNVTYFVKTDADLEGIVLRVAPINRHLLFDFEKSMMGAEPFLYKLLKENEIPAPEVIHYDNSYRIIDREYIIFKYIRSIPLNDIAVPADVKPDIYQRLGEIVALLHNIRNERFGWKRPNNELAMYESWGEFLHRFAQEIIERASNYAVFSDAELNRFINVFTNRGEFDQIAQAHMVHADLWDGNVLVSENDGEWDVAAIIDIDKAIFGDKELDFAYPTMLNDAFLKGYCARADESIGSIFRRNAYRLLESFKYAYIWFVQFGNKERYMASKKDGLSALELF